MACRYGNEYIVKVQVKFTEIHEAVGFLNHVVSLPVNPTVARQVNSLVSRSWSRKKIGMSRPLRAAKMISNVRVVRAAIPQLVARIRAFQEWFASFWN